MSTVDFSNLSALQRLDLIDELWKSVDIDRLLLTPAQTAEIDRRLATLDGDSERARSSEEALSDLKARYRQ